MHVCLCLCSRWLSDSWSLLSGLPLLALRKASIPLFPSTSSSLHAVRRRRRAKLLFCCVSGCAPSSPCPFLCFSSPLTKSLFRIDTAEKHMECDITMAGCSEKGMIQQWRDWSVRSLQSEVIRKTLWEAHREGESREGGFFSSFFSDLFPPG